MNAETFNLPMTPHIRATAVIEAAKDYSAAREAFYAADDALAAARKAKQPYTGALSDDLDAAADQMGTAQERVAHLVVELTQSGALDKISELLAAETARRP